ncbi:MAG: Si-specific NAD(P)(+) transhydrogenase [Planctomycetales bacterium]|nr:Si-specific NAD(P)(+) transhydrogenase [Planctomycetales bacterium]
MRYDLVVIGSGPAGQKGAIAAAKLGKRVAVVERTGTGMGGVCVNTGTIPSKTMREAILHLTGFRHREIYGERYRSKRHITMHDLCRQVAQVVEHERDVIRDQLERNGIDVLTGAARFAGPHEVNVEKERDLVRLETDYVLVACGTKPARPESLPFDGKRVFDSDDILGLESIPRLLVVVGGGVIGIEYAIMFATLGSRVTVVDGRDRLLEFCDREIVDSLLFHARSLGMVFRLGENVTRIDAIREGRLAIELESGKRLIGESVLFTAGRVGDTESLNLGAAGLSADERGRLRCDKDHRTAVSHIYAVGDVVGFPALASVAMEQGRRAVCHAFGQPFIACENLPYGLFTIPEISMIGQSEEQLTAAHVPYEVGVARYREIARGQINGDHYGLLKLLFDRHTRRILGVHCIGEMATEIVHIGQAVMSFGGTIDYFRDTVFNYPTMAECYKVAAFDGLNKLMLDQQDGNAAEETVATQQEQQVLDSISELLGAVGHGSHWSLAPRIPASSDTFDVVKAPQ